MGKKITEHDLEIIREKVFDYADYKKSKDALDATKDALQEITGLDSSEVDRVVAEILSERTKDSAFQGLFKRGYVGAISATILVVIVFLVIKLNLSGQVNKESIDPYETEVAKRNTAPEDLVAYKTFGLNLYPDKDLPYSVTIKLDGTYAVRSIGVTTDWWAKRPVNITILDAPEGKVLGKMVYPHRLMDICGYDFKSKCKHPDENGSATAELLVPLYSEKKINEFTVQLDDLLSRANKFVIFKGIRVYGKKAN